MIIYTIIGIILEVLLTRFYISNNIESLNGEKKISKSSVKKLNLLKSIIFLISSIIIITFWITMLKFSTKSLFVLIILLILDIVMFLIFKGKIKKYILKNKKRKIKKVVHRD